jgi:hypothetical protein
MENKKNGSDLPDISGIFDIDENDVPSSSFEKFETSSYTSSDSGRTTERTGRTTERTSGTTERTGRTTENTRTSRTHRPEDKIPHEKTDEELVEAARERRRRANAKKIRVLRRRRLLAACIGLVIIIIAVFAIRAAVISSKKPVVLLYETTIGDVAEEYDFPGAIITTSVSGSPIDTYAIVPENTYDVDGIKTGQRAVITDADGSTYNATVNLIADEAGDSTLTAEIKKVLPTVTISSTSNVLVYVKPEGTVNLANDSAVTVTIVTEEVTDTVFVPDGCINTDEDGKYVWEYSGLTKSIKKCYVTTSLSVDGNTAIIGGLKKNKKIVLSVVSSNPEYPVSDGSKVKISDTEETTVKEETTEESTTNG